MIFSFLRDGAIFKYHKQPGWCRICTRIIFFVFERWSNFQRLQATRMQAGWCFVVFERQSNFQKLQATQMMSDFQCLQLCYCCCVWCCVEQLLSKTIREVSKTSQLLTFAHFDTTKPLLAHSTQTQLERPTQRRRIPRSSTWNCISRTNSFKNTASMKHQNPTVLPFFQNYLWKKCIWKTWCPKTMVSG